MERGRGFPFGPFISPATYNLAGDIGKYFDERTRIGPTPKSLCKALEYGVVERDHVMMPQISTQPCRICGVLQPNAVDHLAHF